MLRRKRSEDAKMLRKKVDYPLTKAIRDEIKRLADEENFTLGTLRAIERVAAHGCAMLQGTADLDGLLGGAGIGQVDYSGGTLPASSPVENFGSRAMRELTAMLPKILEGRNRPSTVELVRSLAFARKEGLDDIAADLEQQIKGAVADKPDSVVVEKPVGLDFPKDLPAEDETPDPRDDPPEIGRGAA